MKWKLGLYRGYLCSNSILMVVIEDHGQDRERLSDSRPASEATLLGQEASKVLPNVRVRLVPAHSLKSLQVC